MELTRVIVGPIVTEKSERMKEKRVYVMQVDPAATKIDVKKALQKHFEVEVASVRVMWIRKKTRSLGAGREMVKRQPAKRVIVTLKPKSKAFDIVAFKTA